MSLVQTRHEYVILNEEGVPVIAGTNMMYQVFPKEHPNVPQTHLT